MDRHSSPFLTARWQHLVMLNFEIDPRVLAPLVPVGTELDSWQGKTLISLVGFLFRDVRVWGVPIPFHRQFEEVNLRFYVRRRDGHTWRRGVVFVKEFAPRRAIGWGARVFYGENYAIASMRHRLTWPSGESKSCPAVEYAWKFAGSECRLEASAAGTGRVAREGTQEAHIVEQSWGYSGRPGRPTIEYRVEHPPWKVWTAGRARFEGNVELLYGRAFVESLTAEPISAYVVDGSSVTVFKGARIGPHDDPASTPPAFGQPFIVHDDSLYWNDPRPRSSIG